MSWIILIIVGAIIGLLGKFIAPGDKDNIPIWLTVVLGIVGTLIGGAIWAAVSNNPGGETAGIDWWRWIIAIAVSVVLVMIASTVMGRNTAKR